MIERTCKHCKAKFQPNKYHPHDQWYCPDPRCQRESACASRKNWRNAQTDNDPEYSKKESKRAAEWRRLKKRKDAALRGLLNPRLLLGRLHEEVRRLEMLIRGLAAFLGGRPASIEDLDSFLARCLDAVRELGWAGEPVSRPSKERR